MTRAIIVATGLALLLSGCTGRSSSGTPAAPSPSGPTTGTVAAPSCPTKVHSDHNLHNSGAPADRLVTPDPVAASVCRYYPLGGLSGPHVPHGTLYGHAELQTAGARTLAAALDAIPQVTATGPHSCPAAFGGIDLLLFAYADNTQLGVQAASDGCPSFTNGVRGVGDFSPAFARYLRLVDRLVPVKRQHGHNKRSPGPTR
jgi:hypothetical protein